MHFHDIVANSNHGTPILPFQLCCNTAGHCSVHQKENVLMSGDRSARDNENLYFEVKVADVCLVFGI